MTELELKDHIAPIRLCELKRQIMPCNGQNTFSLVLVTSMPNISKTFQWIRNRPIRDMSFVAEKVVESYRKLA